MAQLIDVTIHTEDDNGNVITVNKQFTVIWKDKSFTVPAGFQSDGVSTPRFLWVSVSPAIDPTTIRAGVSHDYIYREQPPDWTRKQADQMFYDICRADGLAWIRAQKAYWGLRLFGGVAWKQNAKQKEKNNAQTK